MALKPNWAPYLELIEGIAPVSCHGKVNKVVDISLEGYGFDSFIGERCDVYSKEDGSPIRAEVVGFRDDLVVLMPLGEVRGVGPGSRITGLKRKASITIGDTILGRVIDGLGKPLDGKGPLGTGRMYPLHAPPINPLRRETESDSQLIDLQNVFSVAPGNRLFVGLSYNRTPTEYSSESHFGNAELDQTDNSKAVSAQYDWSPAKSFTASLGGRVDDYSTFGTHNTWRAGGRYTVAASGTILRANVGTAFRAPTVADLYFPGSANPDLEPEESTGWDIGVEQPLLGGRLQVGATWFRIDFDNLIQWTPSAVGPWGGRMENVAEARTDGIEAFVQWLPTESLSLSGSYTWLRTAEDESTGERLLRRPEHSGSLAARYRFPRWVEIDTALRFVGSSDDKNFSSLPGRGRRERRLREVGHIGLTVTPTPRVSLFARVENLLDEEYEQAYRYPALGRVFWGGAPVRF